MAHPQAAHHQLYCVRQLFFDQGHAFAGFPVDPEKHPAHTNYNRGENPCGQGGIGANAEAKKGKGGDPCHDHHQLFGTKGDGRLLCLFGKNGIERDGL